MNLMPEWFRKKKTKHIEEVRHMDSMNTVRYRAQDGIIPCAHPVKDEDGGPIAICQDCKTSLVRKQ